MRGESSSRSKITMKKRDFKWEKRKLSSRQWWADILFVVVTVLVCLYLLSIVSQFLMKAGNSNGQ
jgi:ABC-type Fe3+ transport system permease subunit